MFGEWVYFGVDFVDVNFVKRRLAIAERTHGLAKKDDSFVEEEIVL